MYSAIVCSNLVQCELLVELLKQAGIISNALLRDDFQPTD